jgi:hypothetical protein
MGSNSTSSNSHPTQVIDSNGVYLRHEHKQSAKPDIVRFKYF